MEARRKDQLDLEKVWFSVEQDKDGYPPVMAESIWAAPLSPTNYRLKNVPFFAKE
jgi:hypothetical protein